MRNLLLSQARRFWVATARRTNGSEITLHSRRPLDGIVLAVTYGLPIILSTVNVQTGANKPTVQPLLDALGNIKVYDRTTINAWEDVEFRKAVEATGRKKLVMTALWTEACLTFPTLDALRAGYDVYPVVDAVGGTSVDAHLTGLRRVEQAGAQLTSIPQLLCELQRDWARKDTVPAFVNLLFK
jgi:nicotinamidase-related amidase